MQPQAPSSTPRSSGQRAAALIGVLVALVAVLALCADRVHNGDLYLQLFSGRFLAAHGLVGHDPFPTIAQGHRWLNQQWLSELAFYRVAQGFGLTTLAALYAVLLAAPLALLLWICRRKGRLVLILAAVVYFPGVLAVIHPRAAGFTLLAFSALVGLILAGWVLPSPGAADRSRLRWALLGIPALFALWANLHAGFVAGLLLIALVAVGLSVDRLRELPGSATGRRIALLALAGLLAAAIVSIATPLGSSIWTYIASFRNPSIALGSKEWSNASNSPATAAYIAIAAAFAAWLWWRTPRPRRLMPPLVAAGFLLFAAYSVRNIIFVGPILAFQIAFLAPDRDERPSRLPIALGAPAAATALVVWATVLGPIRDEPRLRSPVVAYALAHPPAHGRIAAYAGVDSYLLWHSPGTPVVIDGWLEHFSSSELRGTYGILRGWHADPTPDVERLDVGAVIAHLPVAIRALEAHGFVAAYATANDTYLVRRGYLRSPG